MSHEKYAGTLDANMKVVSTQKIQTILLHSQKNEPYHCSKTPLQLTIDFVRFLKIGPNEKTF